MKTRSKSLPLALLVATLTATMAVDALAAGADNRPRRTAGAPAPGPVTASAPTIGTAPPPPRICYVTEVLPAPTQAPVVVEPASSGERLVAANGRPRRGPGGAAAVTAPPQPQVITRAVACPEEVGSTLDGGGNAPVLAGGGDTPPATVPSEPPRPGLLPETPPPPSFDDPGPLAVAQVPEPSMLALFGLGAVGLAIARRRRSR